STDRLERDAVADLADDGAAGELVLAVDHHRVRSAHAVRARAAERQRTVLVPLHLVERVEDTVAFLGLDRVGLPVRLGVLFRVVPLDLELDGDGHQYLRSMGWYL